MASSVTVSRSQIGSIERVDLVWTSAFDGSASQTLTLTGLLLQIETDPSSTAPTDDYDITLTDAGGYDVLKGQGSNRDTTTTERVSPLIPATDGTTTTALPPVLHGLHTFTLANAGDSKIGTLSLFLKK